MTTTCVKPPKQMVCEKRENIRRRFCSSAAVIFSSSLSAQTPALYEPPLTTSGSEETTASLSMIDFALHLHIYAWIINQTAVMA